MSRHTHTQTHTRQSECQRHATNHAIILVRMMDSRTIIHLSRREAHKWIYSRAGVDGSPFRDNLGWKLTADRESTASNALLESQPKRAAF
jgi:hypothetical protein